MKHIPAIMALTFLMLTASARAEVTAVTLYPNGGEITERFEAKASRISAGSCTLRVDLPLEADQSSIRIKEIRADDVVYAVEDIGFSVKTRVDSNAVDELKKRLEDKQTRKRELSARRDSLEMRVKMWESQTGGASGRLRSPDQLLELDRAMLSRLEELFLERKRAVLEIERIEQSITEIKQDLKRVGAGTDKKRVAEVVFAADSCPVKAELELSYIHGGCGWEPIYRIAAHPERKTTLFAWKAMVRQSTGRDWIDANLTLSTSRPKRQLRPPGTGSWIIVPRHKLPIAREQKVLGKAEQPARMMDSAAPAAPNQAKRIRKSGFDHWQVGRKSVPAGQSKRLVIREYEWETDFSLLIRPGSQPRAFLEAGIEAGENVMIPKGRAMMTVDGQLLGEQEFSFQGREKTMFFGDVPEITGKRVLVEKKAGEEGILIGKKQTHTFVYRYEITNGRDEEILIRVEDARPRTRHEDIRVELESPLTYQTDENTIFWEVSIDPGQTMEIPLTVSITAPKDMAISMPR